MLGINTLRSDDMPRSVAKQPSWDNLCNPCATTTSTVFAAVSVLAAFLSHLSRRIFQFGEKDIRALERHLDTSKQDIYHRLLFCAISLHSGSLGRSFYYYHLLSNLTKVCTKLCTNFLEPLHSLFQLNDGYCRSWCRRNLV